MRPVATNFLPFLACLIFAAPSLAFEPNEPRNKIETSEDDAQKQAAQERKEKFTTWMREFAEGTKIVAGQPAGDEQPAKIVPNPVFRYSDEERFIPDATLWVWTRDGRPDAFQKVEGNNHGGGQMWTICFASLSEGLVKVAWPGGRVFQTQKPGVKFAPFPKGELPAEKARSRTLQIKALKDRFTGRLNVNADGKLGAETRSMAKPLFEYADADSNLPRGAIFGMSSTGTNPDLLLLIEARSADEGKPRWEYALARMTSASIRVRLDDVEVWSEPGVPPNSPIPENFIYYFLSRSFK